MLTQRKHESPAPALVYMGYLPVVDNQPNPGVAGAFSGFSHHKLLVAGGANFPDAPAWKNGVKRYWVEAKIFNAEAK